MLLGVTLFCSFLNDISDNVKTGSDILTFENFKKNKEIVLHVAKNLNTVFRPVIQCLKFHKTMFMFKNTMVSVCNL